VRAPLVRKEPVENKPHINADTHKHTHTHVDAEEKAHSEAVCVSTRAKMAKT